MDIAENLNYSFEEQCFLQLDILKGELLKEDVDEKTRRYCRRNRLFRWNIFEDVDSYQKHHAENLLCHTLKLLGEQINENIKSAARNKRGRQTPLLLVDRRSSLSHMYDSNGVIYLKPKKHVRFLQNSSRQALILAIIAKAIKIIGTDTYMTKRELYYMLLDFCRLKRKVVRTPSQQLTRGQNPSQNSTLQGMSRNPSSQLLSQNYGSQQAGRDIGERYSPGKLDVALDDLCCLVGCSKVHLHILTQSKGLVYGNLKFKIKSEEMFDCVKKKEGLSIPTAQSPITWIESDAKFILILEKDSILQKILIQEDETNFVKNYKVILFTARGYPDGPSRAFINYLWSKLKIPILALTDADPHGLEIVCSYKFGTYTTAYEEPHLAVPQIRWLGLFPKDMEKLPESQMRPLKPLDLKKIDSLLSRPYIREKTDWIKQLEKMKAFGKKAELEALDSCGAYLVKSYLPDKLRYASWL